MLFLQHSFIMFKTKKILSLLFVVLFMSYYANVTLLSHTHNISGSTIIHSHIHADSHHNTQNGDHTEHCITLIAQLSHFEYIDSSFVEVSHTISLLNKICFVETTHCADSIYLENISLRAPPVV